MSDEHEDDIDPRMFSEKSAFSDRIEKSLYDANIHIIHGEMSTFSCYDHTAVLESMAAKIAAVPPGYGPAQKSIRILLNSVGGNVFDGLLIFDTIESIRRKGIEVIVEVRGLAASMAAVLLQSGTKRISSKYTRFMLHEASDIMFGKTTDIEEQAIELRKTNNMLAQILADRCGKPIEELEQKMRKKDYWLSASEALAFGLVDEVV